MNSEQPQGEYGVTVAFLRLITTLVKVKAIQMESSELVSLLLKPLSLGTTVALTFWC